MQSAPNAMETWFGFIRSIDDAVTVVEAARTGYLPRVTRRLTEDERMVLIRSGSVFVFEESESQVRRWADSRNWSSSRMKSFFLIYQEQEGPRSAPATGDEPDQDVAAAAAAAAASSTASSLMHHHAGQTLNKRDSAISLLSRRSSASTLASLHDVVPARPLLKKKALSLTTAFGNKLRLISYYAEADVAEGILPTPDNDPLLTKIQVPDNLYYAGNDGPIALSKTSTTRQPLSGLDAAGSITIPKALKRRSDPLPQFVWRGPSTSSFTAAPTIPEAPPVHEAAMQLPMSIVSRQLSPMDTDAPPPAPAPPEPATATMRRRSLYDPVTATGHAAAVAEAASRRHSVHLGVALDRPAGDWRVSARYDRTVHAEDARQLRALDRSFNL
ncbi:hypothetical protein AMAG_04386 [Allomyces macrogynus ATCC 38327]|uniref:Uncharacterized protein n=1 Tax=Allomyces macrogynus (strain ATCC 38327) TaxID=578462 RepID=A0A0L0S8N9_ALLM3|nr:hypothetical protein AMAG_04386 [Allomyces macrogynus ATCC 38327]|eukprot:KNE58842.1 hypothetical protein AMAG_04386 [Allomyces macrogynus ATCC 38327]